MAQRDWARSWGPSSWCCLESLGERGTTWAQQQARSGKSEISVVGCFSSRYFIGDFTVIEWDLLVIECEFILVGGLVAINFIFPEKLGISSSQMTKSYFSEGWPNHQPVGRLKRQGSDWQPVTNYRIGCSGMWWEIATNLI